MEWIVHWRPLIISQQDLHFKYCEARTTDILGNELNLNYGRNVSWWGDTNGTELDRISFLSRKVSSCLDRTFSHDARESDLLSDSRVSL